MVPHGRIEETIAEVLGYGERSEATVAIAGVPHQEKGEALVLLTTEAITPEQLRQRLGAAGLPNLWIPRIVRHVDRIPVLGSGKLDLKTCREWAEAEPAPA